jgi:hypothetical protein
MQNDKAMKENPAVCLELLNKVGKPDNFLLCKAMNVFDDKYRVNIYTRRMVEGIEGVSISKSYFVKYSEKGTLTILS